MIFALVLGSLLGGATVLLLDQWRGAHLAATRNPRPTLPERGVAGRGGLVFAPHGRRRPVA